MSLSRAAQEIINGNYYGLTDFGVSAQSLKEVQVGKEVEIRLDYYEISVKKMKKGSNIRVIIADNRKFWGGRIPLIKYTNELEKVLINRNIPINDKYLDPNYYGLSFTFPSISHNFDEILSETRALVKSLDGKVNNNATSNITLDSFGRIPFSLRQIKDKSQKVLSVNYDTINRKYWDADIDIIDLLQVQKEVISLLDDVEILYENLEQLEGLSLYYTKYLPFNTTRKEAEEWLKNNIFNQVISMLEMKAIVS